MPTKLPRGPHGLTREQVEADQRGRLIGAMSMIVAEKGYGDTAVADVVARAGVSRRTFYEQFANKEDCFLAAYDVGARIVIGRIDDALEAAADDVDWRGRVSIALRSFAETLAGQPQLAHAFHLDVLAAGPRALALRAQVLDLFAETFRSQLAAARLVEPGVPEPSGVLLAGLVGGLHELVMECMRARGAEAIPSMADDLVALAVAVLGAGSDNS